LNDIRRPSFLRGSEGCWGLGNL